MSEAVSPAFATWSVVFALACRRKAATTLLGGSMRPNWSRMLVIATCGLTASCGNKVDNATDMGHDMARNTPGDMTVAGDLATPGAPGGSDGMMTSPGDLAAPPDLAPYPIPHYSIGGSVNTILHANNAWYIGGAFKRISTYGAIDLIALDLTGKPVSCDPGAGFDGQVVAVVSDGTSLYVGGSFTHYQNAPASYVAKIDPTTCALDTTFSPPASNGFDFPVTSLVYTGGALYVGGSFQHYRASANALRIAKLDTAGNLDATFMGGGALASPGFDNNVLALATAGTSLYAGGTFNTYRGVANSAAKIAKLDLTSGDIDATFSPAGAGTNGFPNTVASLATSTNYLYVGGFFNSYNKGGGVTNRFARLALSDGTLDTTFCPQSGGNGFDDVVLTIVPAADDSVIYLGGKFSTYKGVAASANRIAKLDSAGTLDTTFSPPGANGFSGIEVDAMALSGSALFVGGSISSYRSVTTPANSFAKLDATTGAMDQTFLPPNSDAGGFAGTQPGGNTEIYSLLVTGSTLWVGGRFTVYGGYTTNDIVKLDEPTWAVDTKFSPASAAGFNNTVNAIVSDGSSLYVGGNFTAYDGSSVSRIAKLDPTSGTLDTTFGVGISGSGFNNSVQALVLAGGSLYAGGSFTSFEGVSANEVAKLNLPAGTLDTSFSPPALNGFNNTVWALAADATSLYAGGSFTTFEGTSANRVAKLGLTSGALDLTFSPATNGFDNTVDTLLVSGTTLFAGGPFTAYRGVANSANFIASLATGDGSIDSVGFNPPGASANGFDAQVQALAANGGALYVGGNFTAYKGVAGSAVRLAKLDAGSGTIDATFAQNVGTGFNAGVNAIAIANGVMAVGGGFTSYDGALAAGLVFLDPATGLVAH
jgi:hypothetical protein